VKRLAPYYQLVVGKNHVSHATCVRTTSYSVRISSLLTLVALGRPSLLFHAGTQARRPSYSGLCRSHQSSTRILELCMKHMPMPLHSHSSALLRLGILGDIYLQHRLLEICYISLRSWVKKS